MILHRLLSALMGIVFVVATTAPMSGHPCQAQGSASEAMPPMPGMPGMPAAPHDHSHPCSCIDSCSCAAVVSIAQDRLVALPVVPIVVIAITRAIVSATLRPTQPDGVVLPPPLGPPALLA
jgi:hypothetical protein